MFMESILWRNCWTTVCFTSNRNVYLSTIMWIFYELILHSYEETTGWLHLLSSWEGRFSPSAHGWICWYVAIVYKSRSLPANDRNNICCFPFFAIKWKMNGRFSVWEADKLLVSLSNYSRRYSRSFWSPLEAFVWAKIALPSNWCSGIITNKRHRCMTYCCQSLSLLFSTLGLLLHCLLSISLPCLTFFGCSYIGNWKLLESYKILYGSLS